MAKENIGVEVKMPTKTCEDKHCPFHSNMSVRGRTFTGVIVSNVIHKSATVAWEKKKFNTKYERYEKKRTKVKAHSTPCIEVKKGDKVKIMESRPISKTKKFIIIEKIE